MSLKLLTQTSHTSSKIQYKPQGNRNLLLNERAFTFPLQHYSDADILHPSPQKYRPHPQLSNDRCRYPVTPAAVSVVYSVLSWIKKHQCERIK